MKKTIKSAVAMLIAIIIACGSLTAFAATPADIQCNLTDADEPTTYAYAGKLTVGGDSAVIKAKEDNSHVYFTFEAEEDGYYKISSTDCSFDGGWFTIPEKFENGVYLGSKDCLAGNDFTDRFFYLEKGEYVTCINFDWLSEDEFKVEYVGDIVDYEFEEEGLKSLIAGKNMGIGYDEDGNKQFNYIPNDGLTVEFSSGEKFVIDFVWLKIYTTQNLTHGEYEVEIGFDGSLYREKKTVNVIDLTKVISKVEMTNIEKYTVIKEYYDGEVDFNSIEGETLTVTYADGTQEIITDFDGDGNLEKYGLWADSYYGLDDWKYVLCISITDVPFIEEKCTALLASAEENLDRYGENNLDELDNAFYWTGYYFKRIFRAESVPEALENAKEFLARTVVRWMNTFANLMKNTATMLDYIALR